MNQCAMSMNMIRRIFELGVIYNYNNNWFISVNHSELKNGVDTVMLLGIMHELSLAKIIIKPDLGFVSVFKNKEHEGILSQQDIYMIIIKKIILVKKNQRRC